MNSELGPLLFSFFEDERGNFLASTAGPNTSASVAMPACGGWVWRGAGWPQ
jgi:hypothetical protein